MMAKTTTFQALREKAKKAVAADKEDTLKTKDASVDSPLASDSDQLDDSDENTRNDDEGDAEAMVDKSVYPLYKKNSQGAYTAESTFDPNLDIELDEELEVLAENVMDDLKRAVGRNMPATIGFKNGKSMKVPFETARTVFSIYGKLAKAQASKMARRIAASPAEFAQMVKFSNEQAALGRKAGLQGPKDVVKEEKYRGDPAAEGAAKKKSFAALRAKRAENSRQSPAADGAVAARRDARKGK